MPKPHYSDAPKKIRDLAELAGMKAGQLAQIQEYFHHGYDVRPEDVKTPVTAQLDALKSKGDLLAIAQFRQTMSIDLRNEQLCLNATIGRRNWAALPSNEERAAAAKVERDRLAKEQAITERTNAILAGEQFKRESMARARAAKELES